MTFRVYFFAEQAFLSFVKKSISSQLQDKDEEIELCAVCIFSCAAALESTVNSLLKNDGRLAHFDELKISSKIETIAEFSQKKIIWGEAPWQEISKLIRIRNWLSHYKDPDIGLINSQGDWIKDSYNAVPKIDPDQELSIESVKKYYLATRQCLKELAQYANVNPSNYDFLETEEYQAVLVG